jgi:hypothetical protein
MARDSYLPTTMEGMEDNTTVHEVLLRFQQNGLVEQWLDGNWRLTPFGCAVWDIYGSDGPRFVSIN